MVDPLEKHLINSVPNLYFLDAAGLFSEMHPHLLNVALNQQPDKIGLDESLPIRLTKKNSESFGLKKEFYEILELGAACAASDLTYTSPNDIRISCMEIMTNGSTLPLKITATLPHTGKVRIPFLFYIKQSDPLRALGHILYHIVNPELKEMYRFKFNSDSSVEDNVLGHALRPKYVLADPLTLRMQRVARLQAIQGSMYLGDFFKPTNIVVNPAGLIPIDLELFSRYHDVPLETVTEHMCETYNIPREKYDVQMHKEFARLKKNAQREAVLLENILSFDKDCFEKYPGLKKIVKSLGRLI